MTHLITDKDLLDYVSGNMTPEIRMRFERRAAQTGQSDLLLYALLADEAATGSSTDDIIGDDSFDINEDNISSRQDTLKFNTSGEMRSAAEIVFPRREKK